MRIRFDRRACKLLLELAKRDDYDTLKNISEDLNLSRWNVEYDLEKVNDVFREIGLPVIEGVPNRGIRLERESREWVEQISEDFHEIIEYVYSKKERIAFILCYVIIGGSQYDVGILSEVLGVSRTTIFSDMRKVKTIVEEYGSQIHYDRYYNYYIEASGEQYISMLKFCFDIFYSLIPEEILRHLVGEEMMQLLKKFERCHKPIFEESLTIKRCAELNQVEFFQL